jgi:hypothetical protein
MRTRFRRHNIGGQLEVRGEPAKTGSDLELLMFSLVLCERTGRRLYASLFCGSEVSFSESIDFSHFVWATTHSSAGLTLYPALTSWRCDFCSSVNAVRGLLSMCDPGPLYV